MRDRPWLVRAATLALPDPVHGPDSLPVAAYLHRYGLTPVEAEAVRERLQLGRERYGVALSTHDGRGVHGPVDAAQEALDLLAYLVRDDASGTGTAAEWRALLGVLATACALADWATARAEMRERGETAPADGAEGEG